MVRIAHFRKILKDVFFKRIKFFAEFLSARDILDAACKGLWGFSHLPDQAKIEVVRNATLRS